MKKEESEEVVALKWMPFSPSSWAGERPAIRRIVLVS